MEFIFIVIIMRIFFLILTIFVLTISFIKPSLSEWRLVLNGSDGNEHYIDTNYVKRNNEIVYFKRLINYLKPNDGFLSEVSHIKGDCNLKKKKDLEIIVYDKPMGKGNSEVIDFSQYEKKWSDWKYLKPKTVTYILLDLVCENT